MLPAHPCAQYTNEWEKYVTRQARWVDSRKRLQDPERRVHAESVIWAFKSPLRQGPDLPGLPRALLLEGRDSSPNSSCAWTTTCTRTARPDRHRRIPPHRRHRLGADEKVAAELDGVEHSHGPPPLTLPTNQALAVGPEIEYSVVPGAGSSRAALLIASELLGSYARTSATKATSPKRMQPQPSPHAIPAPSSSMCATPRCGTTSQIPKSGAPKPPGRSSSPLRHHR